MHDEHWDYSEAKQLGPSRQDRSPSLGSINVGHGQTDRTDRPGVKVKTGQGRENPRFHIAHLIRAVKTQLVRTSKRNFLWMRWSETFSASHDLKKLWREHTNSWVLFSYHLMNVLNMKLPVPGVNEGLVKKEFLPAPRAHRRGKKPCWRRACSSCSSGVSAQVSPRTRPQQGTQPTDWPWKPGRGRVT